MLLYARQDRDGVGQTDKEMSLDDCQVTGHVRAKQRAEAGGQTLVKELF